MQVGLSTAQFKKFQELILQSSGILLKDNQAFLIENRLSVILRDLKLNSFGELLSKLPSNPTLNEQVIDRMTTNETLWFRDASCWNTVKKISIPHMISRLESGSPSANIWSAASSTGQEAYSTSILIGEYLKENFKTSLASRFKILGTDISKTVVVKATKGEYDSFTLSRGMPEAKQRAYFDSQAGRFIIKSEVKKIVNFKNYNLMNSFALLGKFDLIFCRNVLIYFSDKTKTDILNRMAAALNPGGMIILGATESTYGLDVNLNSHSNETGIYLQPK